MGAEFVFEMPVFTRQRDITFHTSLCWINITVRILCLFFILNHMTISFSIHSRHVRCCCHL